MKGLFGGLSFCLVTVIVVVLNMATKICNSCGQEKDISEFHKQKLAKDGYRGDCKTCRNLKNGEYVKNNRHIAKSYYANNKDAFKNRVLLSTYGITLERYNELSLMQNHVCAICSENNSNGHLLSVDHDHSCCPGPKSCGNCLRQLLCGRCNRGIGLFVDNCDRLKSAIEYLKKWR